MALNMLSDPQFSDNFKFGSVIVDPVLGSRDGLLIVSNGHETAPIVPDMTYSLTVPSASAQSGANHLQLVGQSGDPVPALSILDYDPEMELANFGCDIAIANNSDVGNVTLGADGNGNGLLFQGNGVNGYIREVGALSNSLYLGTGGLNYLQVSNGATNILAPTNSTPAKLDFVCGNNTTQMYSITASNTTGGGLTNGCLEMYSYNNSNNSVQQVLNITPQTGVGTTANLTYFGNLTVTGTITGGGLASQVSVVAFPGGGMDDNALAINNSSYISLTQSDPITGLTAPHHVVIDLQGVLYVASPTDWENIEVYCTYQKNGGAPVTLTTGSANTCAIYSTGSVRVYGVTPDSFISTDTITLHLYAKCQINSSFNVGTQGVTWNGAFTCY
jgi:hypothetical protein